MSEIREEDELVDGYDNGLLAWKIDNEGFDYFFRYYLSTDDIIDPELRKWVVAYQQAATLLEDYLIDRGVNLEI